MNFLEKNLKSIGLGFAALIVVGLVITVVTNQSEKKEKTAQENFAVIQEKLNKLNEKTPAADKDAKAPAAVDIVSLKKDLEDFITKNSGTVAAQIAGLSLADIYANEKNNTEALTVLKKIETNSSVLSNVLVLKKTGQILADADQCKEAIAVWEKVLANKKAEFAFADVQIKQALCYQKLNDFQKAEDLLTQVKNNKSEGHEQSSLEAEKVLRLIKFNKASGT